MKKQFRVVALIVDYSIKAKLKFETIATFDTELDAIKFLVDNRERLSKNLAHTGYQIIEYYEIY